MPMLTGEAEEMQIADLTIDFLGRSADFAVTLDEITLISEPSCSGLLLAGGLLVAGMRGGIGQQFKLPRRSQGNCRKTTVQITVGFARNGR